MIEREWDPMAEVIATQCLNSNRPWGTDISANNNQDNPGFAFVGVWKARDNDREIRTGAS